MHGVSYHPARTLALLALLVCAVAGCRSTARDGLPLTSQPSHQRNWDPLVAELPKADFVGNKVHIQNVRNFRYAAEDVYVPNYENRVYDLSKVQTVDFIVVPFQEAADLAHTMISFGLADGERLAISAEARREQGESYSPVGGLLQQYELIYVVADERDVIPLRSRYRGDQVYVYRTRATPLQAQKLLVDMLDRVNQIHAKPEFYHTLTNNCTTNIRDHIEKLAPGRVPWNVAVLLPGRSDEYAYRLGLLDTQLSFAETKQRANITQLANLYSEREDFSNQIRQYR
jgi:hypothetical protein